MECNRDDALRSKNVAEEKLASQDYQGALKFLQKALQLFPGLENTAQMSAVIDVHIAAQKKVSGTEMDWYGILQVDPAAEDIVIKKQYKRLALLLHPDKNKYSGAESAFKLVGEALQVLSDKQQRMMYDNRRKSSGRVGHSTQKKQNRQTNSQMNANRPAAPSNTFITVCPGCQTRYQYYRVYQDQNLLCHQCGFPFIAREYFPSSANGAYNAYGWQHFGQAQPGLNPSSFQPFASASNFASGTSFASDPLHGGAPKYGVPGGVPSADQANQMPNAKVAEEQAAEEHKRKRKIEKDSEKEMRKMEREQQKKAKADQRTQEALERLMAKRKKQAENASQKEKKRRTKKQSSESSADDDDSDSDENISDIEILNHVVDSGSAPRRSSRQRRNVTYRVDVSDDEEVSPATAQSHSPKDTEKKHATNANKEKAPGDTVGNTSVSQDGDSAEKQRFMATAKGKIRINLAKSTATLNADNSAKVNDGMSNQMDQASQECRSEVDHMNGQCEFKSKTKAETDEQFMHAKAKDKAGDQAEEVTDTVLNAGLEAEDEAGEEMEESGEPVTLPDSEFYDFDSDKQNVRAGQVWASYDDADGLPRFYLKVKEVLSLDPFSVSIRWLELQNLSPDQRFLKNLGFLPTCGDSFKLMSSQTLDAVSSLSHILNWEKGPKGMVIIYPRKGDVWALYKNWKPGFRTRKKNLLQEYEMVEVLTDFDKQVGVSVAHLEKLPVHKTLFKRSKDCLEVPVAELCRFSHQVPAYKLQDNEAPENIKDCWELDPASVPLTDSFTGS